MICSISSFTNNIDLKNDDHHLRWSSFKMDFYVLAPSTIHSLSWSKRWTTRTSRENAKRVTQIAQPPRESWALDSFGALNVHSQAVLLRTSINFSNAAVFLRRPASLFRNAASTFQDTRRFRPQGTQKRARALFQKPLLSFVRSAVLVKIGAGDAFHNVSVYKLYRYLCVLTGVLICLQRSVLYILRSNAAYHSTSTLLSSSPSSYSMLRPQR